MFYKHELDATYLDDLLLQLVQSHLEGIDLVVEGLGRVPALVLHRRPTLPFVKQTVHLEKSRQIVVRHSGAN